MECSIGVRSFLLVSILTEICLVSSNNFSVNTVVTSTENKENSSVHKLRSNNGKSFHYEDTSATGGDYYRLTNSHVFDIEKNILGKSLHIGSPDQLERYQLTDSDELVIVPCSYDEIAEKEIDIADAEEVDNEKEQYYDTGIDY